ncbi:hypothetical protein DES41_113105 [Pseudorhodoferax soli]|uniref:Uncharacterized protein n=2 Tax=Pseudorhodoferax soli TaxID=545864 RepID=A0A368XB35_9BURK|nr:hypothetical protein DES41_113105 [Pseudorhodoferax soli]
MTVLIELADYAVALLELVPDPANEQIGKQEMLDYFKQYRHWAFEETADSLKRFGPEHVPDGRALIHTLEIVRCLGDMKHPLETVHSFANGSEPRKQAIWRNDDLLHKVAGVQTRAKAASAALHEIRSTYARVHLDRNDVT